MKPLEMKLVALQDQVWAMLTDSFDDIERIAEKGLDGTPYDNNIVKMVFHSVAGELCDRRAAEIE